MINCVVLCSHRDACTLQLCDLHDIQRSETIDDDEWHDDERWRRSNLRWNENYYEIPCHHFAVVTTSNTIRGARVDNS